MRKFFSWHLGPTKRSTNSRQSTQHRAGDRFRTLTFQSLEPRDMKAADTGATLIATLPPTTSDPSAVAPAQPAPAANAATSADSTTFSTAATASAAPVTATNSATPATVVTALPAADPTASATVSAAQSATPANPSGPDASASSGAATVASQADGSATVAAQTAGTVQASDPNAAPSGTPHAHHKHGDAQNGYGGPSGDQTGSGSHHRHDGQNGYGGLAGTHRGNGGQTASPNVAAAQDGYGGSTGDGYGGSAGDGYGGSAGDGYGGGAGDGYGGSTGDGYGGSTGDGGSTGGTGTGTGTTQGPQIVQFLGSEDTTMWTFSGTVTDDVAISGATVTFGGLLAGTTTTVSSDGLFQTGCEFASGTIGSVTAQVTDSRGLTSNIVFGFVEV